MSVNGVDGQNGGRLQSVCLLHCEVTLLASAAGQDRMTPPGILAPESSSATP